MAAPAPRFPKNDDPAHAGCHVRSVAAGVSRLQHSEKKVKLTLGITGSWQPRLLSFRKMMIRLTPDAT
jgi:hypothetical protein